MSRKTRRLSSPLVLALALAAGAIAAPGASASGDLRSPDARDAARAATPVRSDLRSPDARDSAPAPERSSPTVDLRSPDARDSSVARSLREEVVHVVKPGGFDWGDAGIAGGILAILGLGLGVGAAHRRRPVAGPGVPALRG